MCIKAAPKNRRSRRASTLLCSAQLGKTPQEVAYDALMADGGEAMLYFPLFNYADTDLQALHALRRHPLTFMGLSAAGAHCGAVCDVCMPTFMLTHWTRDRTRGPKLALEHVIRRQTRETAHVAKPSAKCHGAPCPEPHGAVEDHHRGL
jgi:N-acyl-D-amino-acid deacylase